MNRSQTRLIALNKLMISAENARKTPASTEADAELKASIKAHGLKQNLVVHQVGDLFHVHAGGRRLKALHALVKDGVLEADHKVACRIEESENAQETSLVENIIRTAMHPADEYLAFIALQDKGLTVEEIAIRFGITTTRTRQRLKLGRIAPEILEAYRNDDLSLESVMAFTLCDDHKRQLQVFQTLLSNHRLYPPVIREMLTETSCSANSQLARFVGLDAYRAAGGIIIEDLFSNYDNTYLEDIDLLEGLARERLQETASELSKKWKWVEVMLETNYDSFKHFGRLYPKNLPLEPCLREERDQLRERASELEEKYDEDNWSEALQEEEDKILARLKEIEEFDENSVEYGLDQKAISGCIVTLDHAGNMRIEAGLVRPEDIPSSTKTLDEDKGEKSDPETSALLQKLSFICY